MEAMGSARASVRAYDGLCERHGVYLACTDRCQQYEPALAQAGVRQCRAGTAAHPETIDTPKVSDAVGQIFTGTRRCNSTQHGET